MILNSSIDPLAFTSCLLGLQISITMPRSEGTKDQTQGFSHASRQRSTKEATSLAPSLEHVIHSCHLLLFNLGLLTQQLLEYASFSAKARFSREHPLTFSFETQIKYKKDIRKQTQTLGVPQGQPLAHNSSLLSPTLCGHEISTVCHCILTPRALAVGLGVRLPQGQALELLLFH